MKKNIGIIGVWHLGCVLSSCWSSLGHKVIGFDYDSKRIENLKKNIPPIFEPGLEESISQNSEKGLLSFSDNINDLKDCDFVFLTYDTPVRDDDSSDTSILEKSVNDVKSVMKDNSVLIVSSQSPVGYCSYLRKILKSQNNSLDIAYSPENLRLGEAIFCYMNPGRIILGTADKSVEEKCISLFSEITDNIIPMNLESSEMVKHGINSFLSMSIVYANNIAEICEEKGADITDVIKGIKSDERIGTKAYLSPGIGFSGGTLGRDLKVLESANNEGSGFADLFSFIHTSNSKRKNSIVSKIKKLLGGLKGKTISVFGLTYKPGTSTLRRSLPLEIVDLLIAEGADVNAYDPKADYSELNSKPLFKICKSIEEASENSDLMLILTEWNDFKEFDWSKTLNSVKQKYFFDTKNISDKNKLSKLGFKLITLGKKYE